MLYAKSNIKDIVNTIPICSFPNYTPGILVEGEYKDKWFIKTPNRVILLNMHLPTIQWSAVLHKEITLCRYPVSGESITLGEE